MNKRLLVIIVSSFLLSCADTRSHITTSKTDQNTQKTNTNKIKYTCNRNTLLSVQFTSTTHDNDKKIAIINGFGKQAIILPYKSVASGFLYSNGKYMLRGNEEHVTWTVGRMVPFHCSVDDNPPHQKDRK